MVDCLSTVRTRVYDQAVAALGNPCLISKLARDAEEMSNQLFVFRLEHIRRFDMFIRHNQDMSRRNGVNIAERSDLFVAMNDIGSGFTRDDLAEKA